MKQILLIALAIFLLNACKQPASPSTPTTPSDSTQASMTSKEAQNRQTAMESVEAYASGNADQVLKDVDQNAIDYGDGSQAPIQGLDSIKSMMKKGIAVWKTAFPDYNMENVVATASGDTVLVWMESAGTWKGDLMGQKPTGKSFKINSVDYFLFNDAGKITAHRSTPMDDEISRQIGFKEPTHQ